jgi:hypothetical protein
LCIFFENCAVVNFCFLISLNLAPNAFRLSLVIATFLYPHFSWLNYKRLGAKKAKGITSFVEKVVDMYVYNDIMLYISRIRRYRV